MKDGLISKYKQDTNYGDSVIVDSIISESAFKPASNYISDDGIIKHENFMQEVVEEIEEYGGSVNGTSSEIAMYTSHPKISVSYNDVIEDSDEDGKKEDEDEDE